MRVLNADIKVLANVAISFCSVIEIFLCKFVGNKALFFSDNLFSILLIYPVKTCQFLF